MNTMNEIGVESIIIEFNEIEDEDPKRYLTDFKKDLKKGIFNLYEVFPVTENLTSEY
jgi:hypothetical protein